ncbi:MAG: ABC transporter substrate-binding protein [Burkholderiales bacterium]|jgi:iron complex transport system substrate-binding protein|nr:ABC transporter substrate-binding protein [Burkholderiales bacterium]
MKRRRALGALALGTAGLALGSRSARTSAAPTAPARVVSVGGAVTEIVFALGAAPRLVGVDSTSAWPDAARKLPQVGYMRQLSAEGVLSLAPDLLLATHEAGPPAALAQIGSAGIAVHQLHLRHSPEALRENVRDAAAALGMPAAGRGLDARIASEWAATQARVDALKGPKPRVLFVFAHGGGAPMVGGTDTAVDAMLRLAGAVNAAGTLSGYKPLTAEASIAAAPDVLLITQEGLDNVGGADALLAKPGMALTPAGKAKRIVAMPALYLLGFGPRLPQAVADLADKVRAA